MPLYDILNEFQKGHSHIAVVYKDLNQMNGRPVDGKYLDTKKRLHKYGCTLALCNTDLLSESGEREN